MGSGIIFSRRYPQNGVRDDGQLDFVDLKRRFYVFVYTAKLLLFGKDGILFEASISRILHLERAGSGARDQLYY